MRLKATKRFRLLATITTFLVVIASCSDGSDIANSSDVANSSDNTIGSDVISETSEPAPDTTPTSDQTSEVDGAEPDPNALPDMLAFEALSGLEVACGGTQPEPPTTTQFDTMVDQGISPDATVTATITTSCGDLVLDLDPAAAPLTVNNFVFLAREGFYNGIVSHRIVQGSLIQTGDPTATGDGGPGYSFADELPASTAEYGQGSLLMANSGSNLNGSQFIVSIADNSQTFDLSYTKFGQLTQGQEVLDVIGQIPTVGPEGDIPWQAVYIENVTVEIT